MKASERISVRNISKIEALSLLLNHSIIPFSEVSETIHKCYGNKSILISNLGKAKIYIRNHGLIPIDTGYQFLSCGIDNWMVVSIPELSMQNTKALAHQLWR